MSKYVLINVQGVHDIIAEVFDSVSDLEEYLSDFEFDEDVGVENLVPSGEVNLDYQTLKVIEIK